MQLEKEDMNLLKELDSTGELLIFPPEPPMDWYYMYQKLSTPVIAVGGFSQRTGKFAMEIAITKGFAAQGFKPLLVASRPDAAFWGHEALPSYFFDDSIPDNKKIMALNYYFSKLEHLKRPDVFIVGIPGALLPNDLDYFYEFATLSFQISQAVELDDIIMSYPCLGVAETFFSEMELRSESLLGAPICFHNIIGKVFDASNSRELEHLNYTCMDGAYIQAELQKYSAPNISSDCLEKDYAVRICRELIARHA